MHKDCQHQIIVEPLAMSPSLSSRTLNGMDSDENVNPSGIQTKKNLILLPVKKEEHFFPDYHAHFAEFFGILSRQDVLKESK